MRACARTEPPAYGKYPRGEIVVEHMAQYDRILWPESAAPAPAAAGERPIDDDANVERRAAAWDARRVRQEWRAAPAPEDPPPAPAAPEGPPPEGPPAADPPPEDSPPEGPLAADHPAAGDDPRASDEERQPRLRQPRMEFGCGKINLATKPTLTAYAQCGWCGARATRSMKRRPLGFWGAWLVGCPGSERAHYELSLPPERRDPPEGGDEAFCQTVRRTTRAHMKGYDGYNALARHEAPHDSGSDTEPALFP